MFPPFDEERALAACRKMIADLDSGRLALVQVTEISEERAGNGLMLGVLIAVDSQGQEVVLQTVSGLSRQLQEKAAAEDGSPRILVPPIVSASERDKALEENDQAIHELTRQIEALTAEKNDADSAQKRRELEAARTSLCRASLAKVYALYAFQCADGRRRSLEEICRERGIQLPPTGTGDCCAPKLLHYAFSQQLQPVSMCEVYYGKETPHKQSGIHYPPCDERCGILLPAMLGLEIIYRDNDIIVVNKQSGLLSVPGKTEKDCVVNRVRRLFPHCIQQPAVHRLDMETSGLLVLAFTKEAHRELNRQFEAGSVQKKYVALIDGVLAAKGIPQQGKSELYFRPDIEHRPHQMWDSVYGKKAVTEWQIQRVETYHAPGDSRGRAVTRVLFTPHTGRTHQLRLASADSHGFGLPIVGDTLYGSCEKGERLMLHATSLSFTHPVSGKVMSFYCKAPF